MSKKSKFRLQKHWRVAAAGETVFNVSGSHTTPHGREVTYVEGRGGTGRALIPNTYASTNPVIPGTETGSNTTGGNVENVPPYANIIYVPATGGFISSYNPPNASTGGNYASTNPSTGGNYVSTNPDTGGNYANTNPDTGGNVANTNPDTGGNYSTTNPPIPATEIYNPGWYVPVGYFPAGSYVGSPGMLLSNNSPTTFNPANAGYYPGAATGTYNPVTPGTANYNPVIPGTSNYNAIVPGTSNFNPVIPGTSNFNPVVPGNSNFNPVIAGNPGNPIYNPYTPAYTYTQPQAGYTYFNPIIPGNPNYNPPTGANANYNPIFPEVPGESVAVGNIVLPGSNSPGTAAPFVPPQLVDRYAQDPNYPVTIPTSLQGEGAYVIIKNK
jgi:hypothetical protein